MALGGGSFITQNKVLPGTYINFVSAAKANSNLSERGICSMSLELDWGIDGEVFEVTNDDFMKNSLKIFGYPYTHEKLKGLRDLFLNVTTLYAYKLNKGEKASNDYGIAKYSGVRGNDIITVIAKNIDDISKYDVKTYLGTILVDEQTVAYASELSDNDYFVFNKEAELVLTAGASCVEGTNGDVDGLSHQEFLNKIESYSFNTISTVSVDEAIQKMYAAFTKRMRDEVGVKFQTVCYNTPYDYEGVVNVTNKVMDDEYSEASAIYWVTGIIAGCGVNKSNTNKKYDGEFNIYVEYTQAQLEKAIEKGEFLLHKVGDDIRVLSDINSFVSITDTKGNVFKENQSVRVIDQIANDVATIFNTKYLGVVPNDDKGRSSLKMSIAEHHKKLQLIGAIEDFTDDDIVVTQGESKKSVVVSDAITIINAMEQLYMTVQVA